MNVSSAESSSSERNISSKTRMSIFEDGVEADVLIAFHFLDMNPSSQRLLISL